MRKIVWVSALLLIFGSIAAFTYQVGGANDVVGRWDLTIGTSPEARYPSWLEVTRKDGKLAGRFVGRVGSVRPVMKIEFTKGQLQFSLPPQYENTKKDLSFSGGLTPSGQLVRGKSGGLADNMEPWIGVRAPELARNSNPKWSQPISLFNGKDITGWKLKNPNLPNGWKAVSGILENNMPSSDIVSEQRFKDFKLHIEFNVASKSNSGIYLRGRYEVQIQDDYGKPPGSLFIGGVYGFLDPTENAGRKAGEWQTYDITLLGRWVTVVLNGKTVIDNKEIPGITGGALDSKEEDPGPLMLQGDHGKVSFRNIVLTPVTN